MAQQVCSPHGANRTAQPSSRSGKSTLTTVGGEGADAVVVVDVATTIPDDEDGGPKDVDVVAADRWPGLQAAARMSSEIRPHRQSQPGPSPMYNIVSKP